MVMLTECHLIHDYMHVKKEFVGNYSNYTNVLFTDFGVKVFTTYCIHYVLHFLDEFYVF